MTDKEKILLAKALLVRQKHLAKENYIDYVKYTNPEFEPMKYSMFIINKVNDALMKREQMLDGKIAKKNQYLMFSVAPRHGKSMTITETLPSYFMGKYPKSKTIMTAYSSTLADDFARANSNKTKNFNVFGCQIDSDNQERTVYNNGSVCVKAGILGGITGKGANLLLIDDPIKTYEEANSQTYRDKTWKEWQNSLKTRLEPPAIVILIMTRWHEDDLAGRLLNKEYGKPLPWEVINLQLEAEKDDILGRLEGEPLWPDRYGTQFIEEVKSYSQTFNALYQGRPTAEAGNMIKRNWWQYYEVVPDRFDQIIQSWDCTFKDSTGSDYVVGQVWGRVGADKYLLDMTRDRLDLPSTLQAIMQMTYKYPTAHLKLVEDKANGPAVIQMLKHKIPGLFAVNPMGSKIARTQAVLPHIKAGNVYIPQDKEWTKDFIDECSSFPNGQHDDMVDSMTQALQQLIQDYTTLQANSPIDNINHFNTTKKQTGGYQTW